MDKQLEQIYMLSKQELDKLNQDFEELNIECDELPKFIELTQQDIKKISQKIKVKQSLLSKLESTYSANLSNLKKIEATLTSLDTSFTEYQTKIINIKEQTEQTQSDINIKTDEIKLLQDELTSCNATLLQEQDKQKEITKVYLTKTDEIKSQIIKFNTDILTQLNTNLFDCIKSFNQISLTSHKHINILDNTLKSVIFNNLPEEFITNLRDKYISLNFKKIYEDYNTEFTKMNINIGDLISNYEKHKDSKKKDIYEYLDKLNINGDRLKYDFNFGVHYNFPYFNNQINKYNFKQHIEKIKKKIDTINEEVHNNIIIKNIFNNQLYNIFWNANTEYIKIIENYYENYSKTMIGKILKFINNDYIPEELTSFDKELYDNIHNSLIKNNKCYYLIHTVKYKVLLHIIKNIVPSAFGEQATSEYHHLVKDFNNIMKDFCSVIQSRNPHNNIIEYKTNCNTKSNITCYKCHKSRQYLEYVFHMRHSQLSGYGKLISELDDDIKNACKSKCVLNDLLDPLKYKDLEGYESFITAINNYYQSYTIINTYIQHLKDFINDDYESFMEDIKQKSHYTTIFTNHFMYFININTKIILLKLNPTLKTSSDYLNYVKQIFKISLNKEFDDIYELVYFTNLLIN